MKRSTTRRFGDLQTSKQGRNDLVSWCFSLILCVILVVLTAIQIVSSAVFSEDQIMRCVSGTVTTIRRLAYGGLTAG